MPARRASPEVSQRALERDLENYGTGLLELDGWRSFKMEQNFSERKVKLVGEAGMPDRLYLRYYDPRFDRSEWLEGEGTAWQRAQAQVLFVEWKRKGGKAKQHQLDWIAAERARGALVWLAGEDFVATPEGFYEHYAGSGLMRKTISPPGAR